MPRSYRSSVIAPPRRDAGAPRRRTPPAGRRSPGGRSPRGRRAGAPAIAVGQERALLRRRDRVVGRREDERRRAHPAQVRRSRPIPRAPRSSRRSPRGGRRRRPPGTLRHTSGLRRRERGREPPAEHRVDHGLRAAGADGRGPLAPHLGRGEPGARRTRSRAGRRGRARWRRSTWRPRRRSRGRTPTRARARAGRAARVASPASSSMVYGPCGAGVPPWPRWS